MALYGRLAPARVSDTGPVCYIHYVDMFLNAHVATARPGEPCVFGFGAGHTVSLNAPGLLNAPLVPSTAATPTDVCCIEYDALADCFVLVCGTRGAAGMRDVISITDAAAESPRGVLLAHLSTRTRPRVVDGSILTIGATVFDIAVTPATR